jgi:hypothetical protein
MILSCKYCLSQKNLCPRCEGSVIVRKITEVVHAEFFSTSLILCTNPNCKNYGEFKQQDAYSVVIYTCDDCNKDITNKELTKEIA